MNVRWEQPVCGCRGLLGARSLEIRFSTSGASHGEVTQGYPAQVVRARTSSVSSECPGQPWSGQPGLGSQFCPRQRPGKGGASAAEGAAGPVLLTRVSPSEIAAPAGQGPRAVLGAPSHNPTHWAACNDKSPFSHSSRSSQQETPGSCSLQTPRGRTCPAPPSFRRPLVFLGLVRHHSKHSSRSPGLLCVGVSSPPFFAKTLVTGFRAHPEDAD